MEYMDVHNIQFHTATIRRRNKIIATSTARNKKVAEQEASRLALAVLES